MNTLTPSQSRDFLVELQQFTARRITRIVALVAWPLVAGAAYEAFQLGLYGLILFYATVYVLVFLMALLESRVSYKLQAYTIFALAYTVGVAGVVQQGLASDARWFLLIPPVLAGLFLGLRESIIALTFSASILLALGFSFSRWRYQRT